MFNQDASYYTILHTVPHHSKNAKHMKIKGTFLSYISEEKKLRKEQSKTAKSSSKRKDSSLGEAIINAANAGNTSMAYQLN